ncbi:MAG: hypothetical protein KDJ76_08570 [Xanthobacteraceae bacterium]|nr:hypothetical protein [Xanthobacteraceae bacterium]
MGTDFNIKPVGAAAAALPPPASEAPQDAVATELPPHQTVSAGNASSRLRNDSQPGPGGTTSHQVVLDRSSRTIVYQVVDNRTSLVVRQYPEEAILRRRAYFRTLDMMKADRAREREADRTA